MSEEKKVFTIGENIRKFRKEAGLTQKQLAEMTGIAEITIRQYERGKYKPKFDKLISIADALEIPYYWLVIGPPPEEAYQEDPYSFLDNVVDKIKHNVEKFGISETEQRLAIASVISDVMRKLPDNYVVEIDEKGKLFIEELSANNERRSKTRSAEMLLRRLNSAGLDEAIRQLTILARVPEYRKDTNNT